MTKRLHLEEFLVGKLFSGSGGSGTEHNLTFPFPQHRLNVGLLQLLHNNRSVRKKLSLAKLTFYGQCPQLCTLLNPPIHATLSLTVNTASKLSVESTSALDDAAVNDFIQQDRRAAVCSSMESMAHQFQHYDDDDRNHASPTNFSVTRRRRSVVVPQSLPHSTTYYNKDTTRTQTLEWEDLFGRHGLCQNL